MKKPAGGPGDGGGKACVRSTSTCAAQGGSKGGFGYESPALRGIAGLAVRGWGAPKGGKARPENPWCP